ncbi:MAG: fatty acid desaturase [bacterium]|nr:fatty acid desaturase [bacterium]
MNLVVNDVSRATGRNQRTAEAFTARKFTWKSIKDAISPAAYENPPIRGLLYFFRDMTLFVACVAALVLADAWYFVVPLWILSGLLISALFTIGHDAAHGALFASKRLSYWVGFLATIPSLHAYSQWAYGHNRVHHGHTIKLDADFVWHPVSPREYEQKSWIGKLAHRLYWSPFGAGPYYLIEIWFKGMILYTAPNAEARRDQRIMYLIFAAISTALFVGGGYAASISSGANSFAGMAAADVASFDWSAGLWMWTKVFLVPFIIWNYIMGFTVYVHHINEEIPWKSRGDWSPAYGQLFGTVNYHIPRVLNFFLHDIFIHMPHHVQVRIPFYHLKRALADIKAVYGEYVIERDTVFADYLLSTKQCKLFDRESGRWYTYREARELSLSVPAEAS